MANSDIPNVISYTSASQDVTIDKSSINAETQQISKDADPLNPSHFLSLPYELRQQIYRYVFTPAPSLYIQASASITTDVGVLMQDDPTKLWQPMSNLGADIDNSLIHVNHQVHTEVLPILLETLHLHQIFDATLHSPPFTPHQPTLEHHIPSQVLQNLKNVTYHIPHLAHPSHSANQRPCRIPFPFRSAPSLKRFTIRKPFRVNVDMLYDPAALKRLTRAEYEELLPGERLGVWQRTRLLEASLLLNSVGRFGCGGWVSQLICPEIYGTPTVERADDEVLIDGGEGSNSSSIAAGSRGGGGEARTADLCVPVGCEVVLEAEIRLFAGQSWRPAHVETLVVAVDVKTRAVRGKWFEEVRGCALTGGGASEGSGWGEFGIRDVGE